MRCQCMHKPDVPGLMLRQTLYTRTKVRHIFRANRLHYLHGYHADRSLNVDEIESLKESFSKLMVDNSGRLTFEEFRTRLPEGVTSNQETYIKEVFDMTNENGFFGEDEYISINALCKTIAAAEGVISECYETVDMAEASKALTRYTVGLLLQHAKNVDNNCSFGVCFQELFEEADSGESGALPLTSLKGLLSTARDQEVNDEAFNAIQQTLVKYGEEINAVDFISLVPYFMSVTL
ncbi:hypothetical protein CAPTEDRAFT_195461 [Capitella teleta]|uniref:EF-hand domain-containing protein n=1 Tax=Capitella teleta TaxID=283909 RepID=R7TJ34_CAPTE|nr:hypothetical protein CAPTEDRAFT_195461 [Capitella teleta]|eukprot:ELT91120.1 hypothetical protein CAPTEDRAFT_195461 [Capitella teleta]